jgi:steroid delta-isomerase-like uncharacterized protein
MWVRTVVAIAVLVALPFSSSADASEAAKAVVLGMIEAVNDRDFDALDSFVAPDVRRHCGATPGVQIESLDNFKKFLHQDLAGVPDANQKVNFIFADERMVAVHVTYHGTQTGQIGPFPPSGKKIELPFIGLLRVEDGKIAEIWVEWDNLNLLTQLGHLPPPGEPDSASREP